MWEFTNDRPIYLQLMEQMTLMVTNGTYKPGEKAPSVRDLATEAGVNPNTVQRAFSELERNGVLVSQRTTGRYITDDGESLKRLKGRLAKEQIHDFIEKMGKLGFTPVEVVGLIEEETKEVVS